MREVPWRHATGPSSAYWKTPGGVYAVNLDTGLVAFSPNADRNDVYDTATGERITLRIPGDPAVARPDVWLDDTTLVVIAASGDPNREPEELGLYTCTLPEGSCSRAATLRREDFDANTQPVPPDGRWYGPPP